MPIGCAQVSPYRKYVNLRGVTSRDIVHAPRYGSAPIGPAEEAALERFFGAALHTVANPHEHEANDRFEQRFRGVRRAAPRSSPYLHSLELH